MVPSRNSASPMSATRPSIITLVSSNLKAVLHVAFASKHPAKCLEIQHVALVRTEHQSDIGHHEKNREAEGKNACFPASWCAQGQAP